MSTLGLLAALPVLTFQSGEYFYFFQEETVGIKKTAMWRVILTAASRMRSHLGVFFGGVVSSCLSCIYFSGRKLILSEKRQRAGTKQRAVESNNKADSRVTECKYMPIF